MNKRFFIITCLACCMALIGCKKKDDLASKDMTGYTFTMSDLTVKFDSKISDGNYNVTVTTLYGSTATAKRASSSANFTWENSSKASFRLNFEIGNAVSHVFQEEAYDLKLLFSSETMGGAYGNDKYTRVWRNWGTTDYNAATDLTFGTDTFIDEGFSLTK